MNQHLNNKEGRLSWGESYQFLKDPSMYIASHFHHGDFYEVPLPLFRLFVATDPEVVRQVLVHGNDRYCKSRIYWGELKKVVGNALGTLEGDAWIWMKRLHNPFFSREKIAEYLPAVLAINDRFFASWEESCQAGEYLELTTIFGQLNIVTILDLIFGTSQFDRCRELAELIQNGQNHIAWRSQFPWRPYLAPLTPKGIQYRKYIRYLNGFTQSIVDQKTPLGGIRDLMDQLIAFSTYNDHEKLQLEDLRNEIIVNLGAGMETSAVVTTWTLYFLHQHPEYLGRVKDELKRIVGEEPLRPDHARQLPLLTMAVKESMRLCPPSYALFRDALEPERIRGLDVPAGASLLISIYGIHRHPRFWKQPNDFIPERFLEEENFPTYTYIPYGAGPHICIGRHLALPQIVLTLAGLISRFDINFLDPGPVKPKTHTTIKPARPMLVQLHSKKRKL